jgi:hypothetical protein
MASHIGRRKFLATLGSAVAWPLAVGAQQGERVRRIGSERALHASRWQEHRAAHAGGPRA